MLFTSKPDGKPERFIATLFDGPGQCAVIGLDRIADMGVGFAEEFADDARKAVAADEHAADHARIFQRTTPASVLRSAMPMPV